MVYSNTVVYGGNESCKSGHLSIFILLKHLMMLLKCKFFSGLHVYTLSKTLIAYIGPCSSDTPLITCRISICLMMYYKRMMLSTLYTDFYFPLPHGPVFKNITWKQPILVGKDFFYTQFQIQTIFINLQTYRPNWKWSVAFETPYFSFPTLQHFTHLHFINAIFVYQLQY